MLRVGVSFSTYTAGHNPSASHWLLTQTPNVHKRAVKWQKRNCALRAEKKDWGCWTFRARFVDQLGKELRVLQLKDWYWITTERVYASGHGAVLSHYGYSVYNMVVAHYPSFEWMPWNFRQVPTGYWLEAQNQYDYLALHASKRLGVKCLEDWYRVTTNDFTSHVRGFSMVAQYYKFSVIDMLNHLFPAFDCQPWKFSNVNRNYWQVTWNVINYILYAERELNIRHVTDWYSIGPKKLHSLHGGGLLNTQFGGSLVRLLEFVYPTKQWIPWRFESIRSVWSVDENRLSFLRHLESKLDISQIDDWYHVRTQTVVALGGKHLLTGYFSSSLQLFLKWAYPDNDWVAWRFDSCRNNYWNDAANVRQFMSYASKSLRIEEPQDWYRVSKHKLASLGASGLTKKWVETLQKTYPDYTWDLNKLQDRTTRTVQRDLQYCIHKMLPSTN